jgi:subtilisin family serine protease
LIEEYPDHPHVLAVGATKSNDERWTYCKNIFVCGGSNYGPFIDLTAPGHELYSTTVYDLLDPLAAKYRNGSGTSYAAPVVAAVAALIYSVNARFTPGEVESILKDAADKVGSANEFGEGRVNALRAVQLAQERTHQ